MFASNNKNPCKAHILKSVLLPKEAKIRCANTSKLFLIIWRKNHLHFHSHQRPLCYSIYCVRDSAATSLGLGFIHHRLVHCRLFSRKGYPSCVVALGDTPCRPCNYRSRHPSCHRSDLTSPTYRPKTNTVHATANQTHLQHHYLGCPTD